MSNYELVRLLINAGAKPRKPSGDGDDTMTEVMWAAFRGDLDILHLFLQHDFDLETGPGDGETVETLVKRIYKCSLDSLLAVSLEDFDVSVTEEESKAVFIDIDANGDGTVSIDELQQYMRQRTGLPKLYGHDFEKLVMVEFFRFSAASALATSSRARVAANQARQKELGSASEVRVCLPTHVVIIAGTYL